MIIEKIIDISSLSNLIPEIEKHGEWRFDGLFDKNNNIVINKKYRTDQSVWIERIPELHNIRNKVLSVIEPTVSEYPYFKLPEDRVYYETKVLKYGPGDFLQIHFDNPLVNCLADDYPLQGARKEIVGDAKYRWLTVCLYLSTVSGGELFFPRTEKKISIEEGKLVLFPGTVNEYWHSALPVTEGTKYVLTTWVCSKFPPNYEIT